MAFSTPSVTHHPQFFYRSRKLFLLTLPDFNEKIDAKDETAVGAIKVTSDQEDADVKVDGNFVGNTPSQLKLPAGKHTITVAKDGYAEWSKEVQVMAGADLNLKATLKRKE